MRYFYIHGEHTQMTLKSIHRQKQVHENVKYINKSRCFNYL